MSDSTEETNDQTSVEPNKSSTFQLQRILIPLIGLASIVALVAVGLSMGWDAKLSSSFGPSLVKVTGSVTYNGKPVSTGYIQTAPAEGNFRGALGPLDENGNFELSTHIQGSLTKGAYAGIHKFAVVAGESKPGQFAPTPIVPTKVFDILTTDLRISVSRDPAKNQFKIDLQDD